MKTFFFSILFFLHTNNLFAAGANHTTDHKKHDHKEQTAGVKSKTKDKIVIFVKGMVCAFCAQGIEKNFNKHPSVKSTKVNLDRMEVKINLKKNKDLTEKEIKKIVTGAGFSYAGIKE